MPSNATRRAWRNRSVPRRLRHSFQTLIAVTMLGPLAVQAQTLPEGVRLGPSIAGITEYSYPNGLRVLLLPDPGSSTITVNVTYLVGSRHEGYGETGMAHLLEHLLFIESDNGVNVKKELDDRGARWNGTTWYDRTNYFETVNASDANLLWALELEAERMVNMRIDQELLDAEMTVVRNEFERGENDVERVLEERVFSTAYLWHNYGNSTIGSRADIENVTIDRLAAFYQKYYQPDNAVVTIAGQFDPSATLAVLAVTFGAIPRPSRTLDETYTVEPPQDGERVVELRRVGNGQNLNIAYHVPAMGHTESAALDVLAGILTGGGGTGRLDRALVDSGKALSVDATVYQLHDPGMVLFSVVLDDNQSLDEVKSVVFDALRELARQAPMPEEVDRARTRILQGLDRTMADSRRLALNLNESIASGNWQLLFTNYEQVRQVVAEDVETVAGRYFKVSNRTVGTFRPEAVPERTVVPDAPGMDALLRAFTPEITVDAGEALDPAPSALESRIRRSTVGGGMRLALLPKDTRGGRVQASLTLRYGEPSALAGQEAAAEMAGALLMRGTRTRSRQEIQDEMQKLNATIRVNGGLARATASISTTAENLMSTIGLAVEILREPAFPESDFDQIRNQQIARIERRQTEPRTLVAEVLQRNLSPYPRTDVRYVRTSGEEIEDLNRVGLDDVKRFHQQFYGASDGEFVVVGKFEPAEVEDVARALLGSWESPSPYSRIVEDYMDVERINAKIETPDKENAQFSAGLRLRMRDSDADYPALVLANYMFGGGGLTSRLPDRVRNHEGLSYSVRSSFSAPVDGDAALFSASAIANPANTPSVEASFVDELMRTLRDGFTADELASAKPAIRDERIVARSSDAGLLNLISARERWSRTLAWDAELEAKLEALTLEEVNRVFRRRVDQDKFSIVKGGDFGFVGAYR